MLALPASRSRFKPILYCWAALLIGTLLPGFFGWSYLFCLSVLGNGLHRASVRTAQWLLPCLILLSVQPLAGTLPSGRSACALLCCGALFTLMAVGRNAAGQVGSFLLCGTLFILLRFGSDPATGSILLFCAAFIWAFALLRLATFSQPSSTCLRSVRQEETN